MQSTSFNSLQISLKSRKNGILDSGTLSVKVREGLGVLVWWEPEMEEWDEWQKVDWFLKLTLAKKA